ncbi:MAG: S8 family serine peptidase [Nevskia sp.]|nr:S8 family serine peptidase [Nevskia sp.]
MNGRKTLLVLAALLALGGNLLRLALPVAAVAALLAAPAGTFAQGDAAAEGEREASEREQERERESDRETDTSGEQDSDAADLRGDVGLDVEPDVVLAVDLSEQARIGARRLGFRVVQEDTLRGLGFRLTQLSTPGGIPPALAVERLRKADPSGLYDVNPRYFQAGEAACEGIRCDAQKLIGWPQAGCMTAVRLGMVDTAVAASIPALAGRGLLQQHFGNAAALPEAAEHGTEVATILVGNAAAGFAGLLPKATLLAADVFDFSRDRGAATNAAALARGMDWVLTQQSDAINISIAGPDNLVLHETVRRVAQRGVPLVAAAGNLGPDGPPRFPAAYPEVIAVTAVDRDRQVYARANQGDYIDLAAPGVHIWSAGADGSGRFVDGTSFAAPFVAAEAALMHAAAARRTPAEWKAALRKSALPIGAGQQPRVYGAGLLQSAACATAAP